LTVVTHRPQWERLLELLAPIHDQAAATARRLGRSNADGDDLLQEAVLRAHAKLPDLRDERRFRSWFFSILLSVHRNRARRSFWRRFLPLDGEEPDATGAPDAHDTDEQRRQGAARVSRALATLPAAQREAVVLHEIEGYSIEEVAAWQKVTISAVKSRLSRGRDRLRRHYERIGFREGNPIEPRRASNVWVSSSARVALRSGDPSDSAVSLSEGGRG
jgi:RNA polymerase sigma-70 factor (ECF subfamily)